MKQKITRPNKKPNKGELRNIGPVPVAVAGLKFYSFYIIFRQIIRFNLKS